MSSRLGWLAGARDRDDVAVTRPCPRRSATHSRKATPLNNLLAVISDHAAFVGAEVAAGGNPQDPVPLRPGVTVLFMSGYAQGVLDSQGVVEAGVNLIQKPFSEAELLAALRHITASATPHRAP